MEFTGETRDYQDEAFVRAIESPARGFYFMMEMGTGKTRVAIRLIVEKALPDPALIVCPKAVIDSWVNEIAATTKGARVVVLSGTSSERTQKLAQQADFFIINYEGLLVLEHELYLNKRFGVVVGDEAHRLANRTTRQSKIFGRLGRRASFVLLMSGTPVRSDARDLWHQIFLIDGGERLGENYWGFQATNFVNVSKTRIPNWQPRRGSEEKIRVRYADVAHNVRKSDVLASLPPQIFHTRSLTMTPRQMRAYYEMAQDLVVELEGEERDGKVATAHTVLTRYLRLHQIAQGFIYDEDKTVVEEFEPNPKTRELLTLLEEHDGPKSIVWCIYRHTIETLMKTLKGKGYNPIALYGGVKDYGAVVKAFQEDKSVGPLIGQPQAGGLGVTLTAADLAIFYTSGWSWPDRDQAVARNHRIGSEIHDSINVVDLVAKGSIDERILKVVMNKAEVSDLLTDFRAHIEQFHPKRMGVA
jgi:SNF2 family DNA or RNA helicase